MTTTESATPRFETLFDVLWELRRVDDRLDARREELEALREELAALEAERSLLAATALPVMAPSRGGMRAMAVDRDCVYLYLASDGWGDARPRLIRLRPESPLRIALPAPPPAYCPSYDPATGDLCTCPGCRALIEAEADRHGVAVAPAPAEDRCC